MQPCHVRVRLPTLWQHPSRPLHELRRNRLGLEPDSSVTGPMKELCTCFYLSSPPRSGNGRIAPPCASIIYDGWATDEGSVLGLDCHHSVIKQMVFVWWLARCGVEPHSELRSRRDLKAVIIEESPGVLEYKRGVRFIDIIDKLFYSETCFPGGQRSSQRPPTACGDSHPALATNLTLIGP